VSDIDAYLRARSASGRSDALRRVLGLEPSSVTTMDAHDDTGDTTPAADLERQDDDQPVESAKLDTAQLDELAGQLDKLLAAVPVDGARDERLRDLIAAFSAGLKGELPR